MEHWNTGCKIRRSLGHKGRPVETPNQIPTANLGMRNKEPKLRAELFLAVGFGSLVEEEDTANDIFTWCFPGGGMQSVSKPASNSRPLEASETSLECVNVETS